MAGIRLVINALTLADINHRGQVDKAGMPYIEHLIRVSKIKDEKPFFGDNFKICAAGLLHDILEDTSLTVKELKKKIRDTDVVKAVVALTRKKEESYAAYIDRVCENELALFVKLSDIQDHLYYQNGFEMPDSLRKRYKDAEAKLLEHMRKLTSDFNPLYNIDALQYFGIA